jgi:predicted dehydrogenase
MVGTGLMLDLIGRDLMTTENVDLRVLVSRTAERAATKAAAFGIPEHSADYEAVLARPDIDVVYIATPHTSHFEQAMAALDAGKHVLVEKPMTTDAAHTRELCAAARARGLFAMEAMWTAFNPAIVELRRRLADGVIGDVHLLHANFCFPAPYVADWRLWAKDLAGGTTLDQGVYPISLAHMLFGVPTRITAHGTVLHDVDAEVATTLDFAAGERAICLSSLRTSAPNDAYVSGSAGWVRLDAPFFATTRFVVNGPGDRTDVFAIEREGAGYVPMLRAVTAAILEGRTEHDLRTHADTVAVAETMDDVLRQVLP